MNVRWTKLLAPIACVVLTACGAPVEDGSTDDAPTKSELAEQLANGKADHMVDWCQEFGWYDDGICDDFCLKPDPDCTSDSYDPCADLTCGDSCSLCDPTDDDCYETAVVKTCQPDGTCSAASAVCDGDGDDEYEPCGGLTCGDSCSLCDPNDDDCFETTVLKYCQDDGTCSADAPDCDGNDGGDDETYEPCGGLTCGESCTICDPNDPDCFETAVLKYCQADGSCSADAPRCDDDGDDEEAYEPCGGLTCGESCTICDPNDPDCFETAVLKYCQPDGSCEAGEPAACTPGYDACAGKMCGDGCSLCDPNDPDCFETLELKECNADGVCTAAPAVCQ